jgi:uncharacterized protein
MPLGTRVLVKSDPLLIRFAIALFGTLRLALLIAVDVGLARQAHNFDHRNRRRSGWLGAAAHIGGPPIGAYWLSRPIAAETVRVLPVAIATVMTGTVCLATGLSTRAVVRLALITGPSLGLRFTPAFAYPGSPAKSPSAGYALR